MNCPICQSSVVQKRLELYDDRYGYPGVYSLVRCRECSHLFLDTSFRQEAINILYSNYYPRKEFDVNDFKPAPAVSGLHAWLNGERRSAYCWVPRNVRVLDVGCGWGEALAYHQSRGCDAYGVEADDNAKRVADRCGLKIKIGLFDASLYPEGFFDYVTLDQVIEHLASPIQTLKDIASVLKKNGVLILSTPNAQGWGAAVFGRKWINWHTPYHLNLFSKDSIGFAAHKAGFAMEQIRTVTSSEWLYYQFAHLITFPPLNTPSIFWSPGNNARWGWKQITVRRFFKVLHKAKLTHLVTRFFDAIGYGDGMLVFLRKV